MAQSKHIYESPDGGRTIYRRELGNSKRELHYVDPVFQAECELKDEHQLWHNIRVAAQDNPQLSAMLEQVKIYYHLINEDSHHHQI